MPITFSERLRAHRSATGATQEQVGLALGVSRSRVAQLEGDPADKPSIAVLVRAEALLAVPLSDLLRESYGIVAAGG